MVTESLIAAASAAKRDEALVLAYQTLLTTQLEFVRYRQDRGWDWADDMLEAFQQRLIAVGNAGPSRARTGSLMCSALIEARVPVDDDVQIALADAGFKPEEVERATRRDDAHGAPFHGRTGQHGVLAIRGH